MTPYTRSAQRPLIAKSELQKFRYVLAKFLGRPQSVSEPPGYNELDFPELTKTILSDERLKGHFGYASLEEIARMDHLNLERHADVLLGWIEHWLR